MPDVPYLESQQAFCPRKSIQLRAVENNLCVSRNVEQVAGFKIDEEQARARIQHDVAERVEEAVAGEIGEGQRVVAIRAHKTGLASTVRHVHPV